MVGTQQVGEDARPSRKSYGLMQSAFLVGQILLASTYYLGISLYHPF